MVTNPSPPPSSPEAKAALGAAEPHTRHEQSIYAAGVVAGREWQLRELVERFNGLASISTEQQALAFKVCAETCRARLENTYE